MSRPEVLVVGPLRPDQMQVLEASLHAAPLRPGGGQGRLPDGKAGEDPRRRHHRRLRLHRRPAGEAPQPRDRRLLRGRPRQDRRRGLPRPRGAGDEHARRPQRRRGRPRLRPRHRLPARDAAGGRLGPLRRVGAEGHDADDHEPQGQDDRDRRARAHRARGRRPGAGVQDAGRLYRAEPAGRALRLRAGLDRARPAGGRPDADLPGRRGDAQPDRRRGAGGARAGRLARQHGPRQRGGRAGASRRAEGGDDPRRRARRLLERAEAGPRAGRAAQRRGLPAPFERHLRDPRRHVRSWCWTTWPRTSRASRC